MKVHGKTAAPTSTEKITFKRGTGKLEFKVSPMPLGYNSRLYTFIESPEPPMVAAKGPGGSQLIEKGKVVMEPDRNDATYREKLMINDRRYSALQVTVMLRNDPDVEFDAVQPTGDDAAQWTAYADAIWIELGAFGITDAEVATIISTGRDMSANSWDPDTEASRFLARIRVADRKEVSLMKTETLKSLTEELQSILSGEPVNGGD